MIKINAFSKIVVSNAIVLCPLALNPTCSTANHGFRIGM